MAERIVQVGPDLERELFGVLDNRKGRFITPFFSSFEDATEESAKIQAQIGTRRAAQKEKPVSTLLRQEEIVVVSGLKIGDSIPVKTSKDRPRKEIAIRIKNVRYAPEHYVFSTTNQPWS